MAEKYSRLPVTFLSFLFRCQRSFGTNAAESEDSEIKVSIQNKTKFVIILNNILFYIFYNMKCHKINNKELYKTLYLLNTNINNYTFFMYYNCIDGFNSFAVVVCIKGCLPY